MLSAWDIRAAMRRSSIEHTVQNALEAAAALGEQAPDVASMVLCIAQRVVDPGQKARFLGGLARVETDAGRPDQGLTLLLAALAAAPLLGRETVLEVLQAGAATLASIDDGELLQKVCLELQAIDDWFEA